jgi:hypothetical protein
MLAHYGVPPPSIERWLPEGEEAGHKKQRKAGKHHAHGGKKG